MNKMIWLLVFLILLVSACTSINSKNSENSLQELQIHTSEGFKTIQVKIANTEQEREQGLMYREQLRENRGMLFVYPNEQELNFWMKNTKIPLDIIFLDREGKIVNIASAEPCKQEPCKVYSSNGMAQFALEVNQGKVIEWNLQKGRTILADQLVKWIEN